jgi:hypothetical protein
MRLNRLISNRYGHLPDSQTIQRYKMELVKTMETPEGKKLYECPTDGWVEGIIRSETGSIVCPHCGFELESDSLGDLEEDDPDATKPLDR